jgi:DNA modification methylase
MTPYYKDSTVTIYHGNAMEMMPEFNMPVITDPPYNVGYHYIGGSDNRSREEYDALIKTCLRAPSVVIAYPEVVFHLAALLSLEPLRSAAWVYPSNTPRQFRLISWFGLEGYPERVQQPYKNPTDARVMRLMEQGKLARGYDWREIPQVKNVSEEKTEHPCQNPAALMEWVIKSTDADVLIDPFMGSGSTLRAAKDTGRKAIGIEIEERYCEIAADMLRQTPLLFSGEMK